MWLRGTPALVSLSGNYDPLLSNPSHPVTSLVTSKLGGWRGGEEGGRYMGPDGKRRERERWSVSGSSRNPPIYYYSRTQVCTW